MVKTLVSELLLHTSKYYIYGFPLDYRLKGSQITARPSENKLILEVAKNVS